MMTPREARPRSAGARRATVSAAVVAGILTVACSRSNGSDAGAAGVAGGTPGPAATASKDSSRSGLITVPPAQRDHLHVQPVTVTSFRPTLETTGTVAFDADISTQVLAPISGPVTRILVQPGAAVRRGDPLALVSSPDFATAVADFRKAQGSAVQTRRVAELDQQLFKNDAIARRDLEQAQTDAAAAAADRDAALQQLRALGVDEPTIAALRDNRPVQIAGAAVRAPIAGTVVEKLINPGQLLQAGTTPCFTIADLSTMWVEASVFEGDLGVVHRGDRADVTTGASPTPLAGTVRYIAAEVDPASKATAVRVVVPNVGRLLKKEMYVKVAIHSSSERQGMLVPVSAVLRDEQNLPFVFVESAPGAFGRRPVTVGSRVGDRFEIRSGLAAGDRIIVEGGLFLQFAQSQ